MTCGKEKRFVSVGEIFSRGSPDEIKEGTWIIYPPWAGDTDCSTPNFRDQNGATITIGQVAWSVNLYMDSERVAPGKGFRQKAIEELRRWGATETDIKTLLGG